jgi:hypothetical protein
MNSFRIRGASWAIAIAVVTAATGVARAQQASVPFLLISPDARASAMGETGTGLANDASAVFWNPAGLAYLTKPQVGLTYSRWLPMFNTPDLFYGYVNGAMPVPDWGGTIGGSFTWLNLGQFERRDAANTYLGLFRSFEFALAGAYATQLSTDIAGGMQLRYINSSLAPLGTEAERGKGIGQSVSFDIGVLWKPDSLVLFDDFDLSKVISVGLNLTNIGPKITYIDASQADPLPTTLRLGFAVHAVSDEFNDLTFTADIAKLMVHRDSAGSDPLPISLWTAWKNPGLETSFGSEYWYDKVVAVRLGFYTEPASIGGRRFITLGAGLRYDIYGFDFSYINPLEANHPLANTLRFTLQFNF